MYASAPPSPLIRMAPCPPLPQKQNLRIPAASRADGLHGASTRIPPRSPPRITRAPSGRLLPRPPSCLPQQCLTLSARLAPHRSAYLRHPAACPDDRFSTRPSQLPASPAHTKALPPALCYISRC